MKEKPLGASGGFLKDQVAAPVSFICFVSICPPSQVCCRAFVRFKSNPHQSPSRRQTTTLHPTYTRGQYLPAPPSTFCPKCEASSHYARTNQEHHRHDSINVPPPLHPAPPPAHPSARPCATPAHHTRQVTPPTLATRSGGYAPIEKPVPRGSQIPTNEGSGWRKGVLAGKLEENGAFGGKEAYRAFVPGNFNVRVTGPQCPKHRMTLRGLHLSLWGDRVSTLLDCPASPVDLRANGATLDACLFA